MNKKEFQRRFRAVEDAYTKDLVKERDVKELYGKIADFVEFMEQEKDIGKLIEKYHKDSKVKELDERLIELSDQILEELRKHYSAIKTIISERGINLPTSEQVHSNRPSGVVISLSLEESLGSELDSLGKRLDENTDIDIHEIPRVCSSFGIVVMELRTLGVPYVIQDYDENLGKKEREYGNLLDKRFRRLDYLCVPDYQKIRDVKEALDHLEFEKGLSFKFQMSYKYASSRSTDGWMTIQSHHAKELKDEKEEYFEAIKRIYELVLYLHDNKRHLLKKFLKFMDGVLEIKFLKEGLLFALGAAGSQLVEHLPTIISLILKRSTTLFVLVLILLGN